MTPTYPKTSRTQRFCGALASVLITLCVVLTNLELADLELARHASTGTGTGSVRAAVTQGIVEA